MNDEIAEQQGLFYNKVAELLGCTEHAYKKFPYRKRTRWNARVLGNGRYPGFGLVRIFGSKVHISLYKPVRVNRWFDSMELALVFLGNPT
jgi:hypothetical protein